MNKSKIRIMMFCINCKYEIGINEGLLYNLEVISANFYRLL